MKILLTSLLVSLPLCSLMAGKVDIPRGVYRIGELEEAQREAQNEEKGLAFVYTHESTN